MVILEKQFIILNIQEYEKKEGDKIKRYKKYTCRDIDAPSFCHDYYYILDFKNFAIVEKGLIYNFQMYLNSKRGGLFLVLDKIL